MPRSGIALPTTGLFVSLKLFWMPMSIGASFM